MSEKQDKHNTNSNTRKTSTARKNTKATGLSRTHHKKKNDMIMSSKPTSSTHLKKDSEQKILTKPIMVLLIIAALFMGFNQLKITQISEYSGMSMSSALSFSGRAQGVANLGAVDIDSLKSTGHTVAAVFPELANVQTPDEAMAVMFPTGTPEYGEELGVSFDEPIESLATLARMYPALKAEVETNNPEAWQRFLSLGNKPVGISCEYCCGVGPIGIDTRGNSRCGCQHNPALLTVALYLTAYKDYTDAEILREVMKWKTLFFPKNMIELGMTVSGGDTSKLQNLPGMVGGC